MAGQLGDATCKLIIYGVHLFRDPRHSSLCRIWEDHVSKITADKSADVDLRFIRLSLASIFETDGKTFKEEMHLLQDHFKVTQSHPTRIPGALRRVWSGRRKPQEHRTVSYMIIAHDLAAWMVRDLMFRDEDILRRTVVLVFQQIPGTSAPDALPSSKNDVTNRKPPTKQYLRDLKRLFGESKSLSRESENQMLMEDEDGLHPLSADLEKIDKIFSKLSALRSVSWMIETQYVLPDNILSFSNRDAVERDLHRLMLDAITRLHSNVDHTGVVSEESLPDEMPLAQRINTGNSRETSRSLSSFTQAYPFFDVEVLSENSAPNDSAQHMERSRLMDLMDQALSSFYAGDLRNADRFLSVCMKYLDPTDPRSSEAKLENAVETTLQINLLQGMTWFQMGRLHKAKHLLRDTLKRVEQWMLQDDISNQWARCIQADLLYWYSVALSRAGDYTPARESLELLIKSIGKIESTEDPFFALSFDTHRTLALVKTHLGTFQDNDKDTDLQESRRLLGDLSVSNMRKRSQNQQKRNTMSQSGSDEQNQDVHGIEKDTFIQKMQRQKLAGAHHRLGLTVSLILILQGDLTAARKELEDLSGTLTVELGANDLLTLEAAVTLASIHVNTTKVSEGEKLAVNARNRIAEHVDKNHPLALEATHVAIMAYAAQGREEEALRTCQHLCQDAEKHEIFGPTTEDQILHPRISAYYTQLSNAHVAVGNYKEAEQLLDTRLIKPSRLDHRILPLVQARNLSHLAWAQLHLGKLEEAEKGLGRALGILFRCYLPKNWVTFSAGVQNGDSSETALIDSDTVLKVLKHMQDGSTPSWVHHPDILSTLAICSELRSRQRTSEANFVLEARKALFSSLSKLLGESSARVLRAQLALGYAFNALGHSIGTESQIEMFKQALNQFQQVSAYCDTEKHLHKDHPLSLEAKREIELSKVILSDGSNINMEHTVRVLNTIGSRQGRILGSYRTQTLQTRLCGLSAAVALHERPPNEEKDRIALLSQLREVREQRLLESLRMEERLAQVYFMAGSKGICIDILKSLRNVEKLENNEEDRSWEIYKACCDISSRAKARLGDEHYEGVRVSGRA